MFRCQVRGDFSKLQLSTALSMKVTRIIFDNFIKHSDIGRRQILIAIPYICSIMNVGLIWPKCVVIGCLSSFV